MSFQSPAKDYKEPPLDITAVLQHHKYASFFMYANTDAMIGAFIHPGSILAIDRSLTAKNGDIVVAAIDGEFMVRYIRMNEHTCWLYPANKNYREIRVTPEMGMTVWGVVRHIVIDANEVRHV